MENIILTPKEFLFLCAGMGVTEVYGIIDGYKDVNLSDISTEIRLVQQSLENKGYIESDFDGNSSVRSEVIAYVATCAMCQKLIAFDSQMKSGDKTNVVYYFSNEKIVKSTRKDGNYHLSYVNAVDINDEIKEGIKLDLVDAPQQFNEVHIPQRELDKIKKMVLSNDKKTAIIAMQKYFDANFTNIILSSFEKKENFYSVVAVDFTLNDDNVKNIMFINSNIANIKMQPIVVDLKTEIEFEEIDEQTIFSLIDNNLKLVITEQTGDDTNG